MNHLDAMRAYVRVVELGSFTAAAREQHVKQSTVSKWVKQLEEEHHTSLIQRSSRTLRVTDAGQKFYARCIQILDVYEQAHAELQSHASQLSGRLRVSLPVVFGEHFFIEPLSAFAAAHPAIELELILDDTYVNLLDQGMDLAIRVGSPVDSALHAVTLAKMPRLLVASPDYLARHGTPDTPQALSNHMALLHRLTQDDHWSFQTPQGTTRVSLRRSSVSANHSGALLTLARQGFGIAMLAEWLVAKDIARGELVSVLPETALPTVYVQILSASAHPSRRARALVDALRHAFSAEDAL